jgi:deoxyribodipyrimidine photo-lyase
MMDHGRVEGFRYLPRPLLTLMYLLLGLDVLRHHSALGMALSSSSSSMATSSPLRLIWHRRDLRLHDNSLYESLQDDGHHTKSRIKVVSLYVFDDADFQVRPATCTTTTAGANKNWTAVNTGPHAARLQLESVQDLRESLRGIGGELLVRRGCPATILSELVEALDPTEVVWHEEPGVYEAKQSEKVWKAIRAVKPLVCIRTQMQYTLYHPDDLPLGEDDWQMHLAPKTSKKNKKKKRNKKTANQSSSPSPESKSKPFNTERDSLVDLSARRWEGMPRIMGEFRKAARETARPRPCLPAPTQLYTPDVLPLLPGTIPTMSELYHSLMESLKTRPVLGLSPETIQMVLDHSEQRASVVSNHRPHHRGGEQVALARLADFCQNHAATAARNLACVDNHQSSHLSHSLAFGCLSPRRVVEEAEKYGQDCSWIISHMTMRDFFLYTCLANDSKFYRLEGIPVSQKHSEKLIWSDWNDPGVLHKWERWALGETGLPLVDAAMKELLATGYCSNRVRQNVASVLAKDLGIDWRAGAEWFQFLLEDHCVGANWGNWLYFSGVGPDPKHRHFRTVSQALKYDPDGSYVKQWLPQLGRLEGNEAYLRPWDFTDDWKEPIVLPESQYVWQDLQRLKEKGALIQLRVEEKSSNI